MTNSIRSFVALLAVVVCAALLLINISGCGVSALTPALTPAEKAEVDKYIAEHGRGALVYYLQDVDENTDGNRVLKYVKYFVSQGADVNMNVENRKYHNFDETPLHIAARYGRLDVVQFLVSKGADVNASAHGYTPLHNAARYGRLGVAQFLVSKGADVNRPFL